MRLVFAAFAGLFFAKAGAVQNDNSGALAGFRQCETMDVHHMHLDENLVRQGLSGDDGSEEYALGVLHEALTLSPPPIRGENHQAFMRFEREYSLYYQRLTAAMEASMHLIQSGRLTLPSQTVLEVDTPQDMQLNRRGKNNAKKQLRPILSDAYERHTLDPMHTDATRRFLLFLLKYRGPTGPLDVNLKTEDSLATSQRPLLMDCLDKLKLDAELCGAIIDGGHDNRPYMENPDSTDVWTGGFGTNDGLTGGTFLQQILIDNSVPIIKRFFSAFAHMRANATLSIEDAFSTPDGGQRSSWNGNIHLCLPQVACASPSAQRLMQQISASGVVPESLPVTISSAIQAELTVQLLHRFAQQPSFDRTNFWVHQATRGNNILHFVALSNARATLDALLEYLLPSGSFQREDPAAAAKKLKTLLGWKDAMTQRTPLHQSAALFGPASPVYQRLVQVDNELFDGSTANSRDALGLRHSDYRDGGASLLFREGETAVTDSVIATASDEGPFKHVKALLNPDDGDQSTAASPRVRTLDDPDCLSPGSGCLIGDSSEGGWATTRIPADTAAEMPLLDTQRCDMLEVVTGMPTRAELAAYLAQSRPVVFRGAVKDWDFRERWTQENFLATYGDKPGRFSTIPYASSFNFEEQELLVKDWVQLWGGNSSSTAVSQGADGSQSPAVKTLNNGANVAAKHLHNSSSATPNYLFSAEFADQNPQLKQDGHNAFELLQEQDFVAHEDGAINLQLYVGPAGSGSPHHWHGPAINALAWGTKHWLLFPPNSTEYGTVPALDYYLESLSDLRSDPSTTVYECTQGPGDLMFVPINWGHSTLNLESTIGMALEFQHQPDRYVYEFPVYENNFPNNNGGGGRHFSLPDASSAKVLRPTTKGATLEPYSEYNRRQQASNAYRSRGGSKRTSGSRAGAPAAIYQSMRTRRSPR